EQGGCRDRNPELTGESSQHSVEASRRDTDDREIVATEIHGTADRRLRPLKPLLPHGIRNDNYSVRPRSSILLGKKPTAALRTNADDIEIIARDKLAENPLGTLSGCQN